MKHRVNTSVGVAVLNTVLNYILSRRWKDYDDFSIRITEMILKRKPTNEKELSDLLSKIGGQFFRLNGVVKRDFVRGFPLQRVMERMNSKIVFTHEHIDQVHRTIQLYKPKIERIYVENIDSFSEVKRISREKAQEFVPLDIPEGFVKKALCQILAVSPVKDWGGEKSDLYGDVKYLDKLMPTAFMLKGKGTPGKLTVGKCGKNGDQILRLVEEPARLFVVQHIDSIDTYVIKLLEIAVGSVARGNKKLYYCVMDGIETARILLAYGFLQ